MADCAFVGLGVMGYPMAGHLVASGHDVTVYKPHGVQGRGLGGRARRARPPPLPPERQPMRSSCSCAWETTTMSARLPPATVACWRPWPRDRSWSTHTTASADLAQELHVAAAERGVGFVDAPISGGPGRC